MIEVLVFGISINRGGIETYYKKIVDNIDRSRFHFSFIDMTGEGNVPAFYDELKANGCTFYKVCPRRVSASRNKADLEQLFTEHHFDVLHISINTLSYVKPINIAIKHGCSVLVHSRNAGMTINPVTASLHYLNKFLIKFRRVKRIAVSRQAGEWLYGKSKFDVYPNGVDTARFRFSQESRERIRKELGCEDKLVIGNVGAFLPVKNQAFTIGVFEKILTKRPNAVLWLVGEGPTFSSIKELVVEKGLSDKVLFLGKRNDVPDVYCGMDAHLLPSHFEGLPNVIIEAQTSGLPCLLSDTITEQVKITDLVEYMSLEKSPVEWTEMILSMLNKKDRPSAYHEINQKGWSVQKEIERLENLYTRVAQGDLS